MSFKVSRVNQPTLISEKLLPYLRVAGELTQRDIDQVLSENRQGSYTGDYRLLCEYLGLWRRAHNRYIYDLDMELADDSSEQLFQLLSRLPHFRRYLDVRYEQNRVPKTGDITIKDEREQQFLKRRRSMLSTWTEHFEAEFSADHFATLREEYESESIQVSEEFLFYDSHSSFTTAAEDRTVLLLLLIFAQQEGFSLDLSEVAARLDVEPTTLRTIVENVYEPLAINVSKTDTSLILKTNLTLTLHHTNRVARSFATLDITDEEVTPTTLADSSETLKDTLVDSTLFRVSPESADLNSGQSSVELAKTESEPHRFSQTTPDSIEQAIESVWTSSSISGWTPIPQGDFRQLGTFKRALNDVLDEGTDKSAPGRPKWCFKTLFREPVSVAGPVPFLTRDPPHNNGQLGEWVTSEHADRQEALARMFLFICSPALRVLTILAGERHEVPLRSPYLVPVDGSEPPLSEIYQALSSADSIDHEFILSPNDPTAAMDSLIETSTWVGLIEKDKRAGEYEIADKFDQVLNSYPSVFDIYDQESNRLCETLRTEL